MKKIFQPRVLGAYVKALLILAGFQSSAATAVTGDISKEIGELRNTVTSVDVYTIPTFWTARIQLHEQDVVASGCHYVVAEKQDLDSLFQVLANAQLAPYMASVYGFDAHTVFQFHHGTSATVSLVLSPEYVSAAARGMYRDTISVTTKIGFGTDLLNWKKQHQPVHPENLMCQNR